MQKLIFNTIDFALHLHFQSWHFPYQNPAKIYSNHYNSQMPKANIASQQSRLEGDERKLRDISNKKKSSERDLGNRRTEHGALEHAAKEHDRKVKHRDELVAQFAQTQSMYVPARIFPPPHRHLVEIREGLLAGCLQDPPPGSWSPPAGHQCSLFLFLWSRSAKPATYTPRTR